MKQLFGLILGVLSLTVIGCGPPSGVPVSGAITYNGEPVANANVVFTPMGGGTVATGETDGAGKFSQVRTTAGGSGLAPGEYLVSLAPKSTVDTSSETVEYDYTPSPPPPFPVRYLDSSITDLKVTVAKGSPSHFELELKD